MAVKKVDVASIKSDYESFKQEQAKALTDREAAELTKLAGLKRLTNLDLHNSTFGDEAVEGLIQLWQLKTINLLQSQTGRNSPRFTAQGIQRLHAGLPNCTITSDFGTFGPSTSETASPPAATGALAIPSSDPPR